MNNNNKRSAPHVIFLVNSVESNVDTIQRLILNILLYFLDCIDKRTTWGYRFFHGSLHGNPTTPFISTTANQSFRPISTQQMDTFKQDFLKHHQRQAHDEIDDPLTTFSSCSFEIIKRTLIQSMAEFHWTDTDLASESPRRQQSSRKPTKVDVKNFIYLVTPLPQTVTHWHEFIASTQSMDHDEQAVIAKSLRLVHAELRRWLWDGYIENRISLSWIDTEKDISENEQEAKSIYNGVNTILRPFGGGYTQLSKLTADDHSYGNSFAGMFHSLNARTIKVVSEDMALPRTDDELLGDNWSHGVTALSRYPAELIFTPQIAPIQIEMYPVHPSNDDDDQQVPRMTKQIDVLCAIYRHQINIRSLDTDIPQLFLLISKGMENKENNNSNEFCTFIQQLKSRGAVAVVRYGDRFGVVEPKNAYCVLLRLLVTQFKMFDIEPEQKELLMGHHLVATGANALEFLHIPATTAKKEKISTYFKEVPAQQPRSQLKLAPLSSKQANILQAMKERRRQRKEKLAKNKEKKEPMTPIASQEIEEERDVFQLPTTTETLIQSLLELYYGTLYTQKWMLADGMKLMYECINNILSSSNSMLPELLTILKKMAIISSEFDIKHRDLIPSLMDTSSDLSKIPNEEERAYFVAWKNGVIRLQSREIYELELKARNALKTREGRLQMTIYVLLIWLERRAGKRSKNMKAMKTEDTQPVDLDDPDTENQLNIYYTRVTIWENVYDIAQYLYELNSLDIKEYKLDPADISSSAFCTCMNQCLSRAVPDWTKHLVAQCTEGDLMYNTEAALSQTPTLPDSQTSTQRSTLPSSQPSSQQQKLKLKQQQQRQKRHKKRERAPDRIPSSQPKKLRTSDLKDLPFMRREVDLTVRKRPVTTRHAEEATNARIQRSAVNGVPTMKRVGSFIKSAMSPRRPKPEKHEEEEDRVLKVRQPSSPTTPRTRFARDFGVLLSGLGYTPHRHGDGDTTPHRPRRGSLLSVDPNDIQGGELDLDEDVDLDDEGIARTPRRVRQLMMDTTPSGRYARMRNSPGSFKRSAPRSNFTDALLATLSTAAPSGKTTNAGDDDDDLADFHLSDESDDEGGMDLTKLMNFNTNPLRLDSDEDVPLRLDSDEDEDEDEDDDNPYLYK